MKYTLALFLLATTLVTNAQIKPTRHTDNPAYIIDSVLYKKLPIMGWDSIIDVTVLKSSTAQYPNGVAYITSKPTAKYKFTKIETLAQQYLGANKPYMAMVDDVFITDLTDVFIESSYVLKCETLSTRDFVNLQHMPEIMILKVTTASKENIEKSKRIMIRG